MAIAFGVGVGPGDPELMTLKAVRLIRENEVIFVPGASPEDSVAYKIAVQAVPELKEKTLIAVDMPMKKRSEALDQLQRAQARRIADYLDQGQNVVYLTLGDPTIYCSFTYLQKILEEMGYETALVSGITSFCAAAARLNIPLVENDEELRIIPATHKAEPELCPDANYVLMKSGKKIAAIRDHLENSGRSVQAVERCGMEDEKIYRSAAEIPENAGYFSLVIVK